LKEEEEEKKDVSQVPVKKDLDHFIPNEFGQAL
jgi:hypothetical protein